MLSDDVIRRVQRKLAAGTMTQTAIAKSEGISAQSVSRIAKELRKPRDPKKHRRCPECGARVVLPCLSCRILRLGEPPIYGGAEDAGLALELHPKAQERYLETRTQKMLAPSEENQIDEIVDDENLAGDEGQSPTESDLSAIDGESPT